MKEKIFGRGITRKLFGVILALAMVLSLLSVNIVAYAAASTITIATVANGSVTPSINSADPGTQITLTPNPDPGYKLNSIKGTYKSTMETVTNTGATVEGTYYTLTASNRAAAYWGLVYTADTITVTAKGDGVKIEKIVFNVKGTGNSFNINSLSANPAATFSLNGNTLTVTLTTPQQSVVISTTSNSYATDCELNAADVYCTGITPFDRELDIDPSTLTFTMPDGNVTITPSFVADHIHTYGTWSKNGTHHWHECTDANCPDKAGSKKDEDNHRWGDWNSSTGTRSCTENCGATDTCNHNGATTGTCSICKKNLSGGGYTPTPTPTPTPSPAPAPSNNGTIGDGSNNSGTNVSVTISNGNATVSNIPASTINNIANTASGEAIVIDVSKSGSSVTKVTLTKSTLENISAALNSTSNNKDSLIIKTGKAEVEIDAKALSSIAGQARGNIQIVVEDKAEAKLNDSQKDAVRYLDRATGTNGEQTSVERIFEAYIVNGTTRISSFGGGEIAVGKLDYKIPSGKNPNNYFVYYLPESGAAERYVTWIKDGTVFFKTDHLSDYAIVYDETVTNSAGKEVYRLWNPKNGDHLLTTNAAERDDCERAGWKYEGVAFVVSEEGKKVYRLFNPESGEHLYTTSEAERDALVAGGWKHEGTAFTSNGTKEIYRLYGRGMHLFTASKAERDNLVAQGWTYEGVGFKAN